MNDAVILQSLRKSHPVSEYVGYSVQSIHRLEREGRFPKRLQLGPGRVGWFKSDLDAWLGSRGRGPLPSPHRAEAK